MKNKKIILIVFVIIIILLGILIALNIFDSNQENNPNAINTLEDNNIINENLQYNDYKNKTNIIENIQDNIQTNEIDNTQNSNEGNDNMNNQKERIKINLIVNNKTFSATLENNETTRELVSMFPMTLNMSDLHSNEKYNYLNSTLTTNSSRPNRINAGDIKLYGNNCLVVFYENFSNSYSYTDLGNVDNVNEFVSELGSGSVTITFEVANLKN